ncbi:MAG: hypothetical protein DWG75_01340 [Chloroflexi bacterium]|nr:hypothetical protein [Chloroflexota bacterium]
MAFQDRELNCRDCGGAFVFTAGEQEFYATKGLEHDPVRCPSCRATRKMMRPEDRDFAPAYGVYVSWGGRTPRQLHVASCAQCAGMTEVPFRPRDDRPVYCSDCYGDLRRKQEAQESAEATAAATRIATSGTRNILGALEGERPNPLSMLGGDDEATDEAPAADAPATEAATEGGETAEAVAVPATASTDDAAPETDETAEVIEVPATASIE